MQGRAGGGREGAGDHGSKYRTTAMRCCSGEEIELNSDPNKDSDNLLAKQQGRGQWLENYSLHYSGCYNKTPQGLRLWSSG